MFMTSLFLTQAVTERNYVNENIGKLNLTGRIQAYNEDNYSMICVQFSFSEHKALDITDITVYVEIYEDQSYGDGYDLIVPVPQKQSEIEDYMDIYLTKEGKIVTYHVFINYTKIYHNKQMSDPGRTYGEVTYRISTTYIGIFWTRIAISRKEYYKHL